MREEVLLFAADAGGIGEVAVRTSEDRKGFVIHLRVARTGDLLTVATQRKRSEPRVFKTIQASVRTIHRLLGSRPVIVDVGSYFVGVGSDAEEDDP